MSSRSDAQFQQVGTRIPFILSGRPTEVVVQELQRIMTEEGRTGVIQRIILDARKPYLTLEKLSRNTDSEMEQVGVSLHDAIRTASLVEHDYGNEVQANKILFDMFTEVGEEGYVPNFIACGDVAAFLTWAKLRRRTTNVFGVPLVPVKELPGDGFVICASQTKDAIPEDIEFCLKATIPYTPKAKP